jgi:hypothetical protein
MAMFTKPRGCCSGGPAVAFGQELEAPVITAVTTPDDPSHSLTSLFGVSVAAGLTVWVLTKLLGKKG